MFANVKEKFNEIVSSDKFSKVAVLNAAASSTAVVTSALASPVSAAEGDAEMTAVVTAFGSVTGVMESLWDFMIGNPLMCCYMAVGLAAACFGLIKRGKRASR